LCYNYDLRLNLDLSGYHRYSRDTNRAMHLEFGAMKEYRCSEDNLFIEETSPFIYKGRL